jgi:putative transposase
MVQDFRGLNAASHDDRYSMKTVNECIGDTGKTGSTIFSTLDLHHGFWQMPLKEQSRHLTAFSIPGLGQFEWVVRPMGLLGCQASFQRLVELAMAGLVNVFVYINDLLVHTLKEPFRTFAAIRKTFSETQKCELKSLIA